MNPNIGRGRLIERSGEITSGTTIATAGRLTPEQDARFIRQGIDQAAPLKDARLYEMLSDKRYLETFALGTRLLRKPGEVVAADNTGLTPSKRELSVEEVVLTYAPSYSFFEDNIEREGGEQTIADEFAIQFFNDLTDLGYNGDSSTPGFLACNSGWPKLIKDASNTHKADVTAAIYAAADFDTVIFPLVYAALPAKFRAIKDQFTLQVSVDDADKWLANLRARGTPLGDKVTVDGVLPRWNGITVKPRAYLANGTIILNRDKNLAFGVRRGITMETQRQPKLRLVETTISARVDFEFAVEDEVVIGYDITP